MSFDLPRVYPLTDVRLTGLTHSEQIERLAQGGATLVQFREKSLSSQRFYQEAKSALKTARDVGVRLIINDRVDVALALGADGVHLGQDDLSVSAARSLLGANAIIGLSTHSVGQAVAARDEPIDYLAIGPIFGTTTKADTSPVVGLNGIQSVREVVGGLPLVAIGGITTENAPSVIRAGADSVAIISGLLSDPAKIAEKTHQLVASFR